MSERKIISINPELFNEKKPQKSSAWRVGKRKMRFGRSVQPRIVISPKKDKKDKCR